MARSSSTSNRDRLKALPWAGLLQVGLLVGKRINELSAKDRARLGGLLRESRGWPARLSSRDREELRRLLGKLDLRAIGGELVRTGRRRGRR